MALADNDKTSSLSSAKISRFDMKKEREHEKEMLRMKQGYILRLMILLILGIAGLGLLSFGAYMACWSESSITLIFIFIMSGVMLLAFGVTVAISGLHRKNDMVLTANSNKIYFDELSK